MEETSEKVETERSKMVAESLRQSEIEADKVYEERNMDFKPYLSLVVARGEQPSVWMPAAFDQRREYN